MNHHSDTELDEILNLYAGIGGNRKLWGDEHESGVSSNGWYQIYKDDLDSIL